MGKQKDRAEQEMAVGQYVQIHHKGLENIVGRVIHLPSDTQAMVAIRIERRGERVVMHPVINRDELRIVPPPQPAPEAVKKEPKASGNRRSDTKLRSKTRIDKRATKSRGKRS